MIRRSLLALTCVLTSATALRAQVGHTPTQSPFEDLRGRMSVTLAPGWLSTGDDPAGVGPQSGFMATARYDLRIGGPLWIRGRVGYSPGLVRTVKDPTATTPETQVVGERTEPLVIGDAGFALNLTGNKSWHRIVPRVQAGTGFVSTFDSYFDLGNYRFGTKLNFNFGAGVRYVSGGAWELDAELSRVIWKMEYPRAYAGDGSVDDTSILGPRPTAKWNGNTLLSIGVSRFFFR